MHDPLDRRFHWERATQEDRVYDVIIIGGGASGIGVAIDAASRGYSVLLLERYDFGKGTSSRSTKLIHGGVRYLQQGNIKLVQESLEERSRLLRNAGHLVQPLEFILPCENRWQGFYYGAGMKAYDLLARDPSFPRSKMLGSAEVARKIPSVARRSYRSGISYYDGQFDDTRLLISMAQTAAELGAVLLNRATVQELVQSQNGPVEGVVFSDGLSGKTIRVQGRCVINATGPFCDSVRRMDERDAPPLVAASQGIHLVVPKKLFEGETALIVPKTRDGRVVFIIPWHDSVVIGTTDTAIAQIDEEPKPMEGEIDFLIETANGYLERPLSRSDCTSVFTGIRPLVMKSANVATKSLARDHTLQVSASKLITLTGGKWTTYRKMAEDCVDRAIQVHGWKAVPSQTAELRLHGASPNTVPGRVAFPRVYGTDQEILEQWVEEHPEWGIPLRANCSLRPVEVVWAVRKEWATSIEDVLARRTRILFLDAQMAKSIARDVAKILATELQRPESWIEEELHSFLKVASAFEVS